MHLLLRAPRGWPGAVRAGVEHGSVCVGCCLGLMLALFALGAMSVVWMAVVGLAVLAEKTLPGGESFARLVAVALVGLGLWVAVAPASVPGLTQPPETGMGMDAGQ